MLIKDAAHLIADALLPIQNKSKWADLGCGSGTFTKALASCLADGSEIIAIDRLPQEFRLENASVFLEIIRGDMTAAHLFLKDLDGILMANALHFVAAPQQWIEQCISCFRGQPQFLIVEYDTDIPNEWVPYPLSFKLMSQLFYRLGFRHIEQIGSCASVYGGNMYSALIR